jgi:hypothetical protein
VRLTDIRGGVRATAGGDILIDMTAPASEDCSLRAGGDITCSIPSTLEADVQIISGSDIYVNITGRMERIRSMRHHFKIGSGTVGLSLKAGGDVRLSTSDEQVVQGNVTIGYEDLGGIGEQISRQVSESLGSVQLSQEISDKMNRRMQKAMRKAEARMQAAFERLKKREASFKDIEIDWKNRATVEREPVSPVETSYTDHPYEPVTDEERLMILRMVQDKKITIEQAEQLLEALDDQEG